MYRRDAKYDIDSSVVKRTSSFDLPVQRNRSGEYKLKDSSLVFTCMTSDFFVDDADEWRKEAWQMIRQRQDLHFFIITKRILRFEISLPDDWGNGYENVTICSTCEDQNTADERIPVLLELPIKHRRIAHEPMLERIDIEKYLTSGRIENVLCGGESGPDARECRYDWVLDTRAQCIRNGVPFFFKQTGALFIKDDRTYHIQRKYQESQARKAGIDWPGSGR